MAEEQGENANLEDSDFDLDSLSATIAQHEGIETDSKEKIAIEERSILKEINKKQLGVQITLAVKVWNLLTKIGDGKIEKDGDGKYSWGTISDEERKSTLSYKILENMPAKIISLLVTVVAVIGETLPYLAPQLFGALANQRNGLRLRLVLNTFFLSEFFLTARAKGTAEAFKPGNLLNVVLPFAFAAQMVSDHDMFSQIVSDEDLLDATGESSSAEELRAARLVRGARGLQSIRNIAQAKKAIGATKGIKALRATLGLKKAQARAREMLMKEPGVRENLLNEGTSIILILFVIAIMFGTGTGMATPENQEQAFDYLKNIAWIIVPFLAAEYTLKTVFRVLMFDVLNEHTERLRSEVTSAKFRSEFDAILEQHLHEDGYDKVSALIELIDRHEEVIDTLPDFHELLAREELAEGTHEFFIAAFDLKNYSKWSAGKSGLEVREHLNEHFWPIMTLITKYGIEQADEIMEKAAAGEIVELPEDVHMYLVKYIGDAALFAIAIPKDKPEEFKSELAGHVYRNIYHAAVRTKGVVNGIRVASNFTEADQGAIDGGPFIKHADVTGPGINDTARLEGAKPYKSTYLMRGTHYDLLPEEMKKEVFFVDYAVLEGMKDPMRIYAAPVIPVTENHPEAFARGEKVIEIPRTLLPLIKYISARFEQAYREELDPPKARAILEKAQADPELIKWMPWVESVCGYLQRNPDFNEDWNGRVFADKHGGEDPLLAFKAIAAEVAEEIEDSYLEQDDYEGTVSKLERIIANEKLKAIMPWAELYLKTIKKYHQSAQVD